MKAQILEFLNEQIEEGTILKGIVKEKGGLDAINGAIQAFEEVKEFIDELEDEE